jgi:hypothetical protein
MQNKETDSDSIKPAQWLHLGGLLLLLAGAVALLIWQLQVRKEIQLRGQNLQAPTTTDLKNIPINNQKPNTDTLLP